MIGTIVIHSKATVPPDYLLCDGSAVSRTVYATLFALIGTTYGSGDGSSTFNIPNLTGKAIFGKDGTTEFANLNTNGGAKTVNLQHSHIPDTHQHAYASGSPTGGASVIDVDQSGSGTAIGAHTHTISAITCGNQSVASTTNEGSPTQSIMNKYFTAYFLIKAL